MLMLKERKLLSVIHSRAQVGWHLSLANVYINFDTQQRWKEMQLNTIICPTLPSKHTSFKHLHANIVANTNMLTCAR